MYITDKSGIYWKSFSNVTLASQEEKTATRRKNDKNRVTLLCSNATETNNLMVVHN